MWRKGAEPHTKNVLAGPPSCADAWGTVSLILTRSGSFPGVSGPVLVVVMDGVGVGAGNEGDAVALAKTPALDRLKAGYGGTVARTLRAHGLAVGLPSDDDMGNSEVGHNALGAGRVIDQGAKRVNAAVASGEIWQGEAWRRGVARVRASGEPLHLLGLLSDGNVHAHIDHVFAILRRCREEQVAKVRLHILLDGRDVPETSALDYVDPLERLLMELSTEGRDYRIASGGGRMFLTMDRYGADWSMVERGWKHHVLGEGRAFGSAREAIETFRAETPGVGDQNLPGFVIAENGAPVGPIRDGAAVVLWNFRGDRAMEISRAFEDDVFVAFDRGKRPDVTFAGMMQYDGDLLIPKHYLVTPPTIDRTLGEYLASNGVAQFACSETQKYGHVTYFWNGNRSGRFNDQLETYVEVPSDTLPFEERPWMKAAEIADATVTAMLSGKFRHGRINFANGDMVGHTGVRDSAVMAVEAVDLCVGRLLPVIERTKGAIIVTADHGNADEMYEVDKKSGAILRGKAGDPRPKTSHTLNPVPCLVYAPSLKIAAADLPNAGLSNVAATVLTLLGYATPDGFDPSLV